MEIATPTCVLHISIHDTSAGPYPALFDTFPVPKVEKTDNYDVYTDSKLRTTDY